MLQSLPSKAGDRFYDILRKPQQLRLWTITAEW